MYEDYVPPITFPIKPPGPPKIWKVVSVQKNKGEPPMKFSIQEIPEDRYDEVVEHMCTYFIADEPMCKSLNGKEDPDFVETFRHIWKEATKQGLCVGAFTDNPNGDKPILAGVNMLVMSFEQEKFDMKGLKSDKAMKVLEIVLDISKKANGFQKYGVDRYMSAFGLSVHPSYRGASLGSHLLNARVDIGREYKIPVTSTAFTSAISQKLADRCGFETLLEQNYEDILDEMGKPFFPGVKKEAIKVMAKRLY